MSRNQGKKRNPKGKFNKKESPEKTYQELRNDTIALTKKPKLWGYSARTVMRELNLHAKNAKNQVQEVLEELLEEGILYLNEEGRFQSTEKSQDAIIGVIDFVNPRYAFVICEGLDTDVVIDADDLGDALDGDTVKIAVYPPHRGSKPEGEVLEVLKRKREEFVGTIQISRQHAFVVVDNRKMHTDIYIPIDKIKNAQNNEKVLVKITEFPKMGKKPVGFVKEVLGKAGENNTEMHAIMAEYDLPWEFPENVLKAAKGISTVISQEEIAKRRDFRKITTFTIDPDNAKDFDDALSLQKLENGNWEVGVHIADVTHYVKPNTTLEKEAYNRATSVYLVDRVVPMLPEKLSNDLCSLRPNEDKLTFSAVFELNKDAKIVSEWFGRTIIHSDKRFSYEEAQQRIETGKGDFAKEIKTLNTLALKLTEQRYKKGAISFETSEVKFRLDDNGVPLEVVPKVRQEAHKLIEEFMLLANKQVAEFVFNLKKTGTRNTMVYRIHEPPNPEKLSVFSSFVNKFGYKISTDVEKVAASFNKMAGEIEGKPEQNSLQNLAIRVMSKAKYSTEPIGHFGLAFPHYTHFTSPIRRYPDMMSHRLLQHYLDNKKSTDKELSEEKCKHSSDMEKRAADAERASIKYKQVEFMELQDASRTWNGIVTGVTDFGIYVEIVETKCEGMVRLTDLQDDYYELDSQNYRLVGRQTKNVIGFGDMVQVKVKQTNLAKRAIDLELITKNATKRPETNVQGAKKTRRRK